MSDFRPALASLLEANAAYADSFEAGRRPVEPQRRLVVVACMDSRMDVFALLGLEVGDVHVIRNAGGLVTDDVIRSICLSQRVLGTREIVLIHHTDCGLEGVDDGQFADDLEAETGHRPAWTVGGFADVAADVRRCLAEVRSSPFVPHRDHVSGFVFDVNTGHLTPVA